MALVSVNLPIRRLIMNLIKDSHNVPLLPIKDTLRSLEVMPTIKLVEHPQIFTDLLYILSTTKVCL